MKKYLILLSCLLCSINSAYSDNINIKVETKIYSVPNDERYLEINNQKMLKAISERQWVAQNEKSFCPDYDRIEKELIKKGDYKTAIYILEKNKNNCYCDQNRVYRLLGYIYYKQGDYINAIKNYNLFIQASKTINPLIYYERGLVRFQIMDYTGALEDYNFAIKNGLPLNDTFITGETIFDYTKLTRKNIDKDLNMKINEIFTMPVSQDTANIIKLGERAPKKNSRISDKDYYFNLIKSNNKYILAESYNNYAALLIKENDLKNAKAYLETAITINPNLKEIYYNLALISYLNRNYCDALKLIEKYFCNDDFKISKGNFLKEMLLQEEYEKYLENELKHQQHYQANMLKLYCYLYQEDIDKAKMLSQKYNDEYSQAYIYALDNEYEKAIKKIKKLLPIEKVANFFEINIDGRIYSNIAFLEYQNKMYEKALKDIDKAKKFTFNINEIQAYTDAVKLENIILTKTNQ